MKDKEIRYITSVAMMNVGQEFIYHEDEEMFYIVNDFMTGQDNWYD
jgi:hypothetical protein